MLKVDKLSFGYIKKPLCLKDVSFEVKEGDKVAILGGEGMGKTALLRVLCGLEEQYYGSVTYNGKDLKEISKSERKISYLPSLPVLFENKSILYNIEYLYKVSGIKELPVEKLKLCLGEFGICGSLSTKVKKLSLAKKRCLAMARAFIKNADYIFIDDQTSMLSDEDVDLVKNAILRLNTLQNGSKTMIFAFENKKSMIEGINKIVYLSFSKAMIFESLSSLKVVDLFSLNYLDFNTLDLMLKKEEDMFFIEYKEVKEKKKTHIEVLNKIKVGSELRQLIEKNNAINFNEYFKVVLAFDKAHDKSDLTDEMINKNLISGNFYLFDYGTGDKLI